MFPAKILKTVGITKKNPTILQKMEALWYSTEPPNNMKQIFLCQVMLNDIEDAFLVVSP